MTTNEAAAVRDRIKHILAHPLAQRMQSFAQHLAFETDVDPEVAFGIMKAFSQDLDAQASDDVGMSYLERKTRAGTLGLGDAANSTSSADGWSKAVEKANARMGPDAVH